MKHGLIIGALVLVATGVAVWFFYFRTPPAEFRDYAVKKGKITLKVIATGTVLPENRLQIKANVSGRAESVLVVEGQHVRKGQVLMWVSSTERAVILDSARAQGPEEVKKWEDIYKPTPIIAPLDGTIILRAIEPGQTFSTSDAVLVMSDRLTIKAQVDETDLAQIHVGQRAKIILDAYPDQEIESKVNAVAYEAKTVNNVTTYVIDVLPVDKVDFLRSGMTANVTFYGETRDDILVIPSEYIKYDSGKPKVAVKGEGKKSEDRDITIGISDGKRTEVMGGLTEAETIVLELKKDAKAKSNMFSAAQQGGANGGKRR
ncbi:MAG: efflux RND transporter periplasmic adaptor subunit [Pseudobdellovibrio sp.]